jgi:hypothetical protein
MSTEIMGHRNDERRNKRSHARPLLVPRNVTWNSMAIRW